MLYRFYYHRAHPEFRLVLRGDDPFPPETAPALWAYSLDREESDIALQVRDEITRRGYALFNLGVDFEEIQTNRDPAA